MRTPRPSFLLAASLAAGGLIAAGPACAVDSGPGTPAADAAAEVPDSGPPPDAAPPLIDATPACDDVQQAISDGHHADTGGIPWVYNPQNGVGGTQGCLGGCHKEGGAGGEIYTIGGALYDRRTGDGQGGWAGNPIAGATIYVIDANGKVVKMITAENGYFWSDEPVQIPLRTYASGCPDSLGMMANTTGNCSSAACHGPEAKIYLPNAPSLP
ncbi:MAG TPA: hypothetical protein VKZ63_03745 [Kofleriaceae bacterium]|nr:hypothetical protein [Kofleriaceae bacterium]